MDGGALEAKSLPPEASWRCRSTQCRIHAGGLLSALGGDGERRRLVRSDVRQVRWGSEQWQAGAHARLEAGTKRWSSRRMESCGMFASLVRRSSSQPLGQ
jgi:hypothetical protein